ncbi:DUF4190 domain-containing protein [Streptomyces sp. NPDC005811]|uniref:DUF4190 domain-containing protein n=1 Tax=Streptomyces sp. NPDC005811 TaxID=3154565 RepID=UPI0033D9D249
MSDDAPTPAGDAGRGTWPAPAPAEPAAPVDVTPGVPLDKAPQGTGADATPSDRAGAGGAPSDEVRPDEVRPDDVPLAEGSAPDPSPLSTPVSGAAPQPWAAPVAPQPHGAFGAFPPPDPATLAAGPPPHPFAPPLVPTGAVPPPPISPDGPGRMPYGHPGAYGYPLPAQTGYHWPGMPPVESNGIGVTAMVLGIASAVLFCLWPAAIVVGVLGVVFGAIGRRKASRGEATNPGQALAGIILGIAGVILGAGLGTLVFMIPG